MRIINYSYDDEIDRQRIKNEIFTKEKIILFKLIDLKQNLYFSRGIEHHNNSLNKIKNSLIRYEEELISYKKRKTRY
jgi:hypothetical protein